MPLRVGLTYTQMKLGWADKRLNELKIAVAKFRNNAYTVRQYDDLENSLHCIWIEQTVTPDDVPMLLGEFAYALRSGLDQLAWQLALITTDKPSGKTCFPVESKCPLPSDKRYTEKIRSIPPVALQVIESLQPYRDQSRLKQDPLWQLNKLCNIDKHRQVAIGHIPFRLEAEANVVLTARPNFQNGILVSIPLADKDKLELKIEVPDIPFGDPIDTADAIADFEITLDGLRKIYDFVRNDVVPKFEAFFPK
jgi:hypothetical protein